MRLLAIAAVVFALTSAGGASLPGPGIVRLTAETLKFGQRLGGDGGHPVRLQMSLLYNRNVAPGNFGNMIVVCRYLGKGGPLGGGTSYCEATYSLPHGRIQAEGLVKDRALYVLAVTGGTGLYSNIGGEVIVSTFAYGPRQERVLFSLEAIS